MKNRVKLDHILLPSNPMLHKQQLLVLSERFCAHFSSTVVHDSACFCGQRSSSGVLERFK